MFRRQDKRTLDQLDLLYQRLAFLRSKVGDEKADEIEQSPDLFYNSERFRIWYGKARFRAAFMTLVAVPSIFVFLNGGKNGIGYMSKNPAIAAFTYIGVFGASLLIFRKIGGFDKQKYYEQEYSKNYKMLRNVVVR